MLSECQLYVFDVSGGVRVGAGGGGRCKDCKVSGVCRHRDGLSFLVELKFDTPAQ